MTLRSIRASLTLLIAACLPLAAPGAIAGGATWHVEAGAPCPGLGTPADPFCTISAAIAASVNGDEVLVAPGTYGEVVNFLGKRIEVRSTGGAAATFIDGTGLAGRVVLFQSGENNQAVLEGFTITGAAGAGGVLALNSSPTIRECVIRDNVSPFGAGMYVDNGSPLVDGCTFDNNESTQTSNVGGGGALNFRGSRSTFVDCLFTNNRAIAGGGAINNSTSPITVTDCVFMNNTNTGNTGGAISSFRSNIVVRDSLFDGNVSGIGLGSGFGGAVFTFESDPLYENCVFTDNRCNSGGAASDQAGANPIYRDCLFEGNIADLSGGAMSLHTNGTVVERCVFRMNTAGSQGGAINVSSSGPLVRDCLFEGNSATNSAGAIVTGGSTARFERCEIRGNTSVSGGGMLSWSNDFATYTNCKFVGNMGFSGGAARGFSNANPSFYGCLFGANTAGNNGGASFTAGAGHFTFVNCTIVGHTNAATIFGSGAGNASTLVNCIVRDNTGGVSTVSGATATVSYSNLQGGWAGAGSNNIDADPLFADAPAGDFRLGPGSPSIDAGDNGAPPAGLVNDLRGGPRFADDPATPDTGGGTPPIIDMGAYEYLLCPADLNGDGAVNANDLALMLGAWGPGADAADLSNDGAVGAADLALMLGAWGACPL